MWLTSRPYLPHHDVVNDSPVADKRLVRNHGHRARQACGPGRPLQLAEEGPHQRGLPHKVMHKVIIILIII